MWGETVHLLLWLMMGPQYQPQMMMTMIMTIEQLVELELAKTMKLLGETCLSVTLFTTNPK
jgi:hypothetical protein